MPTDKSPSKAYLVRWDVATGKEVERVETRRRGTRGHIAGIPRRAVGTHARTATHPKTKETVAIVPQREAGYGEFDGCFSPDGRQVAVFRLVSLTGNRENPGSLRLFDLDAKVKLADLATGARAVCFTSDGRILAVVSNKEVTLWEAVTAKPIGKRPTTGGGAAFTRDDRRVITGQADGTALAWDFTSTNRAPGSPVQVASEKDLTAWWTALAGADATVAYAAGWELSDRPGYRL